MRNTKNSHSWPFRRLGVWLLLLFCGACSPPQDALDTIREEGVLRVLTRNGPTTYYESQGNPSGFEYHLVKDFADYLNVELEMIPVVSLDELFENLHEGRANLAAAGLSITPERSAALQFGPSYMSVKQLFIYNRTLTDKPADYAALPDLRIRVLGNSSHAEVLRELREQYPSLTWSESRDQETIDLLEQLQQGEIDITMVDANEFHANRAFYPDFRIAMSAGKPGKLAWALSKNADNTALQQALETFFEEIKANGELDRLIDRFFTFNERQSFIRTQTFLKMKEQRLPNYKGLIEQVAIEYDMDWRFLAAISYQESFWNPKAKSPTGVRGMMMLTRPTAKELGVDNRLDPLQSLRGGARYYKKLYTRLPSGIEPPDRSWFALAAYNIGLGHLEDARILTEKSGGNPNLWSDVKETLPLLRQRKWYKQTRYGYARGDEPVRYVENIRRYYSLLTWDELNRYRVPPPRIVSDYLPESLNRGLDAL
ncbi:membrane-bound lytic murein transglycosylase MltF [Spongiibacter sp. UBA1325]|uniref:membrane-bound lytic murein transglycosylase MltF n=1 Tax=Spongiibacter sp. UBA1325 TaxID=1947543 RepID=UPI00257A3156|nr:membrane-bound lytic murein transglycosylase MltF [Spongiibacter sp. UBA1325]